MKSKKALYNITTEFIFQFVVVVCSFILPRIILDYYGSEYNGVIHSITQFLSYISILTLGVSGSTRVAIYKAKGDIVEISKVVKTTQKYMKKVTLAFIVYSLFLSLIYPIVINSNIPSLEISVLVIIIGIGTLFEYAFGVTYSALISAMQSKYIYNIILIIFKIVSTVLSVILICNNYNIAIVKIVGSICIALGPIFLSIIVKKKFKLISNVGISKNALTQKKDVMAHSIANCVHEYTDIFLLSIFSNVIIVSVYSVYNLVLTGIRNIQTIFTNGLEGAFGELWAKNEVEKYRKHFSTFEFLIYSLSSVLFTCTAFLLLPFIRIYTDGITDVNYIIPIFAYLSVLATATMCLRTPYIIAVQSAGKYKETKRGAFVEAFINFFVSAIFVFPFGIVGVTIGTLIANCFRTIQYEMFISKNLLNRTNKIFIKRIVVLCCCFIIALLLKKLIPLFEIDNWFKWIIAGFIYFVESFGITLIMSYLFFIDDLKSSLNIFKRMFKRKVSV